MLEEKCVRINFTSTGSAQLPSKGPAGKILIGTVHFRVPKLRLVGIQNPGTQNIPGSDIEKTLKCFLMRPCLNELQEEYCVKIKLIALD